VSRVSTTVGSTSGTHFMESFVGESASVAELQGRLGNNGFVIAISLKETG
jgi:hypothetical protein